eukprot:Lankesteria_metandrocarpae@DN5258_c0_g1_i3.p2
MFRPLLEQNKLRVLICGGDGTVCWVVSELHKQFGTSSDIYVPVGLLPVGTGNDLSRILGWGVCFDGDVQRSLQRVQKAHSTLLDVWEYKVYDLRTNSELKSGVFTNYLDVGVAAKIANSFHELRTSHPELFQSRLGNKMRFGEISVKDYFVSSSVDLSSAKLYCDGELVEWPMTHVEGVVFLNIPSFAGGVCLWNVEESDIEEQHQWDPIMPSRYTSQTYISNATSSVKKNAKEVIFFQKFTSTFCTFWCKVH